MLVLSLEYLIVKISDKITKNCLKICRDAFLLKRSRAMAYITKRFTLLSILLCCQSYWISAEAVDGQWSPWSPYGSNCSVTCGNGVQMKYRSCSRPSPQGGGKMCTKENSTEESDTDSKQFPCDMGNCYAGMFTNWTECENCTNGISFRYPLCGPDTPCTEAEGKREEKKCRKWHKSTCPNPCEKVTCPTYGVCKDLSTESEPKTECACVMGYEMTADKKSCIRPPPTRPTKRPIPTLPEAQKTVATVVSKSASSILILFVSITLLLFLFLRVFTPDRVIQMNMEIALICAHILLMFPVKTYEDKLKCRIVSILIHFFFTACFAFMMLEALHMYSFVAFVVKRDGLLNRLQNTLVGWGLAIIVICFCVCFDYDNYGGEYHCWLQMNTNLMLGQLVPILILSVVTLTLIEAAGSAEYKPIIGIDKKQLFSAKISQRTNLVILAFVIAHMIVGMFSEYEQNLPLYGTFSILNGITGALIFFLHSSNNQQVRAKLKSAYKSMKYG